MIARRIGHVAHPEPTEALGFEYFDSDNHHRFRRATTGFAAMLHAADQGLIDLHSA